MNDRLKKLFEDTQRAFQRSQAYQTELARRPTETTPTPGEMFTLPVVLPVDLHWLQVMPHPDQPEVSFVVPVDVFPLSGPTDLPLLNHPLGPIMIRCNHGIWLGNDDLSAGRYVGKITPAELRATRQILSDMVTGDLSPSDEQLETEEDPNYEDWTEDLDEALSIVEVWRNRKATVISFAEFKAKQPTNTTERDENSSQKLAASTGGFSDQLRKLEDTSQSTPVQIELDIWKGPGQLNLLQNSSGISLVFQSEEVTPDDALPKIYACLSDKSFALIKWTKFPGGNFWRSQSIEDQTLISLQFQPADSDWQELIIHH